MGAAASYPQKFNFLWDGCGLSYLRFAAVLKVPLRAATHENASFVARQSLISISFLLAPCQPFHGMQRDIPEFF